MSSVFIRGFIIDGLSVERNHVLVRVSVVGGPTERRLPPRALQEVSSTSASFPTWYWVVVVSLHLVLNSWCLASFIGFDIKRREKKKHPVLENRWRKWQQVLFCVKNPNDDPCVRCFLPNDLLGDDKHWLLQCQCLWTAPHTDSHLHQH